MNKVISLNKKVIVFLLLMYVLTLIGFMPSYAYYKTTVIKNGVVTLNTFINLDLTVTGTGVSANSFTLPAGTSKTVNVEVTCDQDHEVSHKMWYKATGAGTFIVTSTNTFPNDIVASDFTKTITYTLTFQNTGTTDVSINLGVQSGFARNEITLEQGKEIKLGESNEIKLPTFIDQIETTPQLDTGIKFYEVNGTTNGNGLYMLSSTANDEYPIYYYRGNVNNNNIYFAENCWKIVRTTSTGGLKLIYNGEATDVDGKKQCLTIGTGTLLPITKAFNNGYSSPAYVGYSLPAASSRYKYSSTTLSSGVYYGSSIDQTTYELVDPQTTLDNNHHYSYNSTDIHATGISGDTGNVRYYYYYKPSSDSYAYFIKFAKTKSIQTILNEMLSEPVSKENSSDIQSYINTWWSNYDATYGEFLEDTEWCNDRSIGELNGWNPNGGDLTKYLYFSSYVRYDQGGFESNPNNIKNTNQPILTCNNVNDKLTVSNGSLTYKIGLLTYDEVAMAGATYNTTNKNYYLYTYSSYWLLAPSNFGNSGAYGGSVVSGLLDYRVSSSFGARPALSLKIGTTISSGDGTKENPYIVGE